MSPVYIQGIEQVVAHAAKHQDTGADEVSIEGLAGSPAQKAAASGVASLDASSKVVQDPATSYIPSAQKAAASGVASLDASSKVVQDPATSYIPSAQKAAASGVASLDASSKVVQDPATAFIPLAQKAAASGVASLNASSLVVQKPADRLSKANFEITLNKLLKGAGAGADPTEIDAPVNTKAYIASATLRNSNDTERSTAETSYTKIKQVLLNANLGACRVKFDLKSGLNDQVAYARIYKNGAAIGGAQTNDTTTYQTMSGDFTGFISGDLIQIYAHVAFGEVGAYVQNMQFYYDYAITAIVGDALTTPLLMTISAISMTNQDP